MDAKWAMKSCRIGLVLAAAALAENPVISHRSLADPNGFVFDDRIYAICSNDDDNVNGYDMKSAVVISTADLLSGLPVGSLGMWGAAGLALLAMAFVVSRLIEEF